MPMDLTNSIADNGSTPPRAIRSPSKFAAVPRFFTKPKHQRHDRKRKPSRQSIDKAMNELEQDYASRSTLHGVSDLIHSPNLFIRSLWLVLMASAASGAIFCTYQVLLEYSKNPVVVSYFVNEKNSMMLPDIIICPFNRFNRTVLDQYGFDWELTQYLELAFPSPAIHEFQREMFNGYVTNLTKLTILDQRLRKILGDRDLNDFFDEAYLRCDGVIKRAGRQDDPCANNESISTMVTSAGRCFRIAGFLQMGSGFGYGHRVTITLPHHVYNPGLNQLLIDGFALKMAEHGKGIAPDLYFIPSGAHAIVTLKAVKYEFKNDPPRYTCLPPEQLPTATYSDLRCFEKCLIEDIEEACQCSLAGSGDPRYRFCSYLETVTCYYQKMGSMDEAKCKQQCIPPCESWDYQATVTYGHFPPPTISFFPNAPPGDELNNTIILEVFYERSEYTTIAHVNAMTAYNFIAQIGGQISLWVGASMLTVVQLMFFCAQVLQLRIGAWLQHSSVSQMCARWWTRLATLCCYDNGQSTTMGHTRDEKTPEGRRRAVRRTEELLPTTTIMASSGAAVDPVDSIIRYESVLGNSTTPQTADMNGRVEMTDVDGSAAVDDVSRSDSQQFYDFKNV